MNLAAELYESGLAYLKAGISIVPLKAGRKPVCKWTPLRERLLTPKELEMYCSYRGVVGLGLIHGPGSGGIAVRDFDVGDSYRGWGAKFPELSATLPTAQTWRGYHVYFVGPPGFVSMPDGEYRGASTHLTIIPPSLHPSGVRYRWVRPLLFPVPSVPDPGAVGLLGLIPPLLGINPSTRPLEVPPTSGNSRGARGAVANSGATGGWMEPPEVARIIQNYLPTRGHVRNDTLLRFVRALRRTSVVWDQRNLRVVFKLWWRQAAAFVVTQDERLSWLQFLDMFGRRPPLPEGLDVPRALADAAGVELPDVASVMGGRYTTVLRVCLLLQRYHGDGFYLSGEDAGRLLECGETLGRAVMRRLVAAGLLERLEKGSNLTGRASRYRCAFPLR